MPQVYEVLADQLVQLGADTLYGIVGSGNFFVAEALRLRGVRFVAARHEAGAVAMTDAWARVTNRVGLCTVHMGPGFTNTLTPLVEAVKARTPLLLLTAEVSRGAIHSNFAIDQEGIASAAGAIPERLHTPETALTDLERAWRRALLERRPVVLLMPQDIQVAELELVTPLHGSFPTLSNAPDIETLAHLADRLRKARQPLILAGRGAVISRARAELERLGEAVGALFATTANAHGLFAGNPWNLGIAGGFSAPRAVELMRQADLILAMGASLTAWTRRHGRLFDPRAEIVQVDIDPGAIGARYPVAFGCVGDVRATASALANLLSPAQQGWRTPEVAERIRRSTWQDTPFEDKSTADFIDPRTASKALDELLPAERVLAIDSGHFMAYPIMYLSIPDERAFVFTQAFQSIGLGLPTAIGAALACPDRVTIAAVGDGGLFMSLPELETVARLKLPVVVAVYNDCAYGAEVHHFAPMGYDTTTVTFPDVDFAALGRALGMRGHTVRSVADLYALGQVLRDRDRYPIVLDMKVNPAVRGDEWFDLAFQGH